MDRLRASTLMVVYQGNSYALNMRFLCLLLFCSSVSLTLIAKAQQVPVQAAESTPALAGAPQQAAPLEHDASITGMVNDGDGELVESAQITLIDGATGRKWSIATGATGRFRFVGLPAGTYTLTVAATGMESMSEPALLQAGQALELPAILLRVATANTDVEVHLSQQDIAEEDLRVEEKQRLAGFVPNFYVAYDWKAPPLTSKQKFKLAGRSIIDPASFIIVGGIAGIEQATNTFPGYHQGAIGYAKRYGAGFADFSIGTVLGGAVLPILFKQDPRYFYKGTGTIKSRALYALSTGVIARGDNGRWQPAYAAITGDFAAGAISNLYYPAGNRNGATVTLENGLLGIAGNSLGNLVQEFLLKKITPTSRKTRTSAP
jgi:hypothetical protein